MLKRKVAKKPVPTTGRRRQSRLAAEKPAAYSYYSRRSEQLLTTGRQLARSETAIKTKQLTRYWRQRFGLAVLLVSAILCLGYVSTLSSQPAVRVNKFSGSPAVLQQITIYQAAAQKILDESVLNRNKITISTATIATQMLNQFPELADVKVSLSLLTHQVTVNLTPATPVVLLTAGNGSFALDSNGVALVTGAQLSTLSGLKLPIVSDESNLKVTLRSRALPSGQVRFIATVVAQLKAQNIPISSMALPAGTSELHIRFEGQPFYAKFNLANDSAPQQVGTLIAVYDRLKQQNIVPGEYIDVRVNGRAYYR